MHYKFISFHLIYLKKTNILSTGTFILLMLINKNLLSCNLYNAFTISLHRYRNTSLVIFNLELIKTMLKRRKESDTYLATVHRHRWSRQIMIKTDKILELSASTVTFISWRVFLFSWWNPQCWLKAEESSSSADKSHSAGWKLQHFTYFHCDLSTSAMSTDSSQVGVTLFPSF